MRKLLLLILFVLSVATLQTQLQAADADFNAQLLERQAGENWYGLYFAGGKVGYLRMATRLDRPGVVDTEEEVAFRIKAMGRTQELRTLSKRSYERTGGALLHMHYSLKSESGETVMEIRKDDNGWKQISVVGGAKSEKTLD